jgi:hypothetical protein
VAIVAKNSILAVVLRDPMNEPLEFLLDLRNNLDEYLVDLSIRSLLDLNEFNNRPVLKAHWLLRGQSEEALLVLRREVFLVNEHATRHLVDLCTTRFVGREEWSFELLARNLVIIDNL